ncbi:efflux transporter outer membrane subunit [Dyella choica]|uniref:Efflux transporter outer membrane subunit n=1 Tax=Dyella choica TaxID=1927959 RepID=A0A3S0RII9_9GAMM|nr:efflux transporter outer membrane subunit [Dyella choica]RUL72183.1 efflux transporter outer membrane subunit [Dyella choica]
MCVGKQSVKLGYLFAAGLCVVAMSGCTPGPAYVRPSVSVPVHYKESASPQGWVTARPGDAADRGNWWQVFADPVLDKLEARVDAGNQTIQKSLADMRQARAQIGVARSSYFPQVTAGADANINHTSKDLVGHSLAGRTVQDYSMGVTATWEPDLFDRIGHAVDAANARAQASEADLASVSLSMHAELALDYVDLRQIDAEAALLKQLVDNYVQAKQLVQTQFDGGIASESELQQAQTQLQVAKAQLIDLGEARAQREHAIAVLMGVAPTDFSLAPVDHSLPLPEIPAGLPSTLLQRRPDIAAAERRVAAANADVGEATSAFFPDLMLSATGGLEASHFAQWAMLPSRFWAIGPALVGTLFDGGRRHAQLSAAEARRDAAAADYRQTVLGAFQEVEDKLASLHVLADEAVAQQRAVDASSRAAQLAMTRYQDGATDYLEVVTTQSVNLAQTRALVELSRRRFAADVGLIKALGGVW